MTNVSISCWEDVCNLTEVCWLDNRQLFHALLDQEVVPLSGWAHNDDPLFTVHKKVFEEEAMAGKEDHEISGALELDGNVFVFTTDPDDGYRSYSGRVLFVPNAQLQTHFHPAKVKIELANSKDWDEDINTAQTPYMLNLVSIESGDLLAKFGTQYYDSYYPCSRFYCDVAMLDEVLRPFSQRNLLTHEVKEAAVSSSTRPSTFRKL